MSETVGLGQIGEAHTVADTFPTVAVAPVDRPQSNQLVGIQILRAIAALMVLVHHVFEESHTLFGEGRFPSRWVLAGASSVDLFFVISGFIMLHASWRQLGQPGAWKTFALRRLIRIYPLYWVCIAVFFACKAIGLYRSIPVTPSTFTASLLLLPGEKLFVSTAWTLVYEMYFYLLFGLWMRSRSPRTVVLGISASSIALICIAAFAMQPSNLRRFLEQPVALDFLYGLALAYLHRAGQRAARPGLWIALAVAGIAISSAMVSRVGAGIEASFQLQERFLYWGIPAALVVYASLALRTGDGRLTRYLRALGDASYSLYMTHGFLMTAYARLLRSEAVAQALPLPVWIVGMMALAVTVGVLTHRFIEVPLATALQTRLRARYAHAL